METGSSLFDTDALNKLPNKALLHSKLVEIVIEPLHEYSGFALFYMSLEHNKKKLVNDNQRLSTKIIIKAINNIKQKIKSARRKIRFNND